MLGKMNPDSNPFPIHSLPPVLRDMAIAIAKSKRVPRALPGVCVLGVASASLGSELQIQSASGRVTRGNLFLASSAKSGVGKSEVLREALEPFYQFEQSIIEKWKTEELPKMQARKIELEISIHRKKMTLNRAKDTPKGKEFEELQKDIAEFNALEKVMCAPVLAVEDILSESLGVLLAANKETLASFSSDSRDIIKNICGRYRRSNEETDEAIYLKAFSGDPLRVNRLGRNPIYLQSPCLSVLWLLQPDMMNLMFTKNGLIASGLMPRFLIADSRAQATKITGHESMSIPSDVKLAYRDLVFDLLRTYRFANATFTIQTESEASRKLVDFFNLTVDIRNEKYNLFESFIARWAEQAWRIAVVLHAAENGGCAHQVPLSVETASAAIELVKWFNKEQIDIMEAVGHQTKKTKRSRILRAIFRKDGEKDITAREVQRLGITSTAAEAHEILERMVKEHDLKSEMRKPKKGRVFRVYSMPNPV